jgi:hypothetical protein
VWYGGPVCVSQDYKPTEAASENLPGAKDRSRRGRLLDHPLQLKFPVSLRFRLISVTRSSKPEALALADDNSDHIMVNSQRRKASVHPQTSITARYGSQLLHPEMDPVVTLAGF